MKKTIFLFSMFFFIGIANAQDLDISLFDDENTPPNLGRSSTPLNTLALTPPPLPDIRIPLENEKPQPSTPPKQERQEESAPLPPSAPIALPKAEPVIPDIPLAKLPQKKEASSQPQQKPLKDVSAFEVSDFSLGMSPQEVLATAARNGYKLVTTKDDIPRFYATDYSYQCRNQGIYIPDKLAKCIKNYACDNGTQYVSEATLKRKNETLHLFFTSNATGNVLYKLIYFNKGDSSLNFTRINYAKKKLRYTEFWDAILQKYGNPDDQKNFIWGNPHGAYMKVSMSGSSYDAMIILEDLYLYSDDYKEAEIVHQEVLPHNKFGF